MNRRELLWNMGGGLGGIALAQLLFEERLLAQVTLRRPRAKRVIQLFMSGAASQCDMFDYKPKLIERNGEAFDPGGEVELFQSDPGVVMRSPWEWKQHGECGKWMSDLVPCLATCVDDIAFIHSMVSKSNVHGPATFMQATGFVRPGFPSMGAWLSYGLGSMNRDLPTFVCLPDARGFPPNGPRNWAAGFLPAQHQGTMIRPGRAAPIAALHPPPDSFVDAETDASALALLERLNTAYAESRPGDARLEARIRSYELAARLQTSAPEVLDLAGESRATRALYGLDDDATADMGRRCLVARRLIERDVRFVQVWSGADNAFPRRNWDSHEDLERDHGTMGRSMDRPAAALLTDLKSRGLLDDTLVMWTTEFGRMPCSQGARGRDHNP
ncbi:MAG: DUF1501 domain-containing protein, partial [Planctomycetota bacterium]